MRIINISQVQGSSDSSAPISTSEQHSENSAPEQQQYQSQSSSSSGSATYAPEPVQGLPEIEPAGPSSEQAPIVAVEPVEVAS